MNFFQENQISLSNNLNRIELLKNQLTNTNSQPKKEEILKNSSKILKNKIKKF